MTTDDIRNAAAALKAKLGSSEQLDDPTGMLADQESALLPIRGSTEQRAIDLSAGPDLSHGDEYYPPSIMKGEPLLYPGETLDTVAGFPTVYHYEPSFQNDTKALVVCVTGSMHLARVFYGGYTGSRPSDFISHSLSNHGFGVLSVSYPLVTEPATMPATGAGFRIQDWGRQAAATARKVIDEYHIPTTSVILISWSMGGRMVVPFNIAAKALGLNVKQYISFAATPGFSSIRALPAGMHCTSSGYFRAPPRLDAFCNQLAEMQLLNGGREVIPREVYLREYIGATPINLIGLGLKYDGTGEFFKDETPHEQETQVLNVAEFPFITALYPTSILDASHAFADRASWGFLMTYKLESMIGRNGLQNAHGASNWGELHNLVHAAPFELCMPVEGNHFFFVGEKSAKVAADMVSYLVEKADMFKARLTELTS